MEKLNTLQIHCQSTMSFQILSYDVSTNFVSYTPKHCNHIKWIDMKYLLRGDGIYYCSDCFAKKCVTSYDMMVTELNKMGCELITQKDEFLNQNIIQKSKVVFKGKCKHIYEMRYFDIMRSAGVCMNCANANKKIKNKLLYTQEKMYAQNIEMQGNLLVNKYLSGIFNIERLLNCLADIIIRPVNCYHEDLWLPLQIKATYKKGSNGCYKFDISQNDYKCLALLCVCIEECKFWLFESSDIPDLVSINICAKSKTVSRSKYNKFCVDKDNLASTLLSLYNSNNSYKAIRTNLEIPIANNHKLEYKYKKLREQNLGDIIVFEYPDSESLVYDFKVNGLNIQEKVATQHHEHHGRYQADIRKRNGNGNVKIPYDESDNNIYWIHIPDTKLFYIIPTVEMAKLGYVSKNGMKGKTGIILHPLLSIEDAKQKKIITADFNKFIFSYETLDTARIKQLLGYA